MTRAVMAGQVKHAKIFSGIMPDMTLLSVLTRLKARNTDALISAVADVMRNHGIELLDSTAFLAPLLARGGRADRAAAQTRTRRPTSSSGTAMADGIAAMDIGQTVAVKDKAVVAVEAMEGTDADDRARRRAGGSRRADHQGGEAEPGHAVRRAGHRRRDDCQAMRRAGASALSIDAGRTLVMDGEHVLSSADEAGITIVGREPLQPARITAARHVEMPDGR